MLDAIRKAHELHLASAEPKRIFQLLLDALIALTGSEYGFIDELRYDADGGPYRLSLALSDISWDEASRALYAQLAARRMEFRDSGSLAGLPAFTGKLVIANDVPRDPRGHGTPAGHPALRSFMGLPLSFGGEIVGSAGVANRAGGYDEALGDWLAPFLSTCAGIIRALRAREREAAAFAALSESNRMMAAILDNYPDSALLLDVHGRVLRCNETVARRRGVPIARLVGAVIYDFLPPELARLRREQIDQVVRSAAPLQWEDSQNGLYLLHRAFPLLDDHGAVSGVAVFARDVTEPRRAMAELRNSLEWLALMQRAANAGFWDWDIAAGKLAWSPEFFALFGLPSTTEPSFDAWRRVLHPDDREAAEVRVHRALEERRPLENEYRIVRPDGAVRWIVATGSTLYDETGRALRMSGICIDSTERRRAEEIDRIELELALALSRTSVLNEALHAGLAAAIEASGLDSGGIYLARDDGGFDLAVDQGLAASFANAFRHADAEAPSVLALRGGAPLYLSAAELCAGYPPEIAAEGLTAVAFVPLLAAGRLIGCLNVGSHGLSEIGPASRAALERIASRAGQAIARIQAEEALRASETKYRTVADFTYDWEFWIAPDGRLRYVSPSCERITGYAPAEFLADPELSAAIVHPADRPAFREHLRASVGSELPAHRMDFRIVAKDGREVWISHACRPVHDARGEPLGRRGSNRDITQAVLAGRRRDAHLAVLRILNENRDLRGMIAALTEFFQQWMGVEAAGIRLRDGEDFPYYEARGFPPEFVLRETQLCARDADGQVVHEPCGAPRLECMCGNVLCNRVDASLPFFTAGGSFWSNCTTELLASTTEADRQARTRNRCNGEGYESVALVPIRHRGETLGLLQLNDHARHRFTGELIAHLEELCAQLASSLAHRRAEEALIASEERFRSVVEDQTEVICRFLPDGTLTFVNDVYCRFFGAARDEAVGSRWQPVALEEDTPTVENRLRALSVERPVAVVENRVRSATGEVRWMQFVNRGLFDADGNLREIQSVGRDVTDRRAAEEALRDSEERYRVLFEGSVTAVAQTLPDGRLVVANLAFARMLGYESPQEVMAAINDLGRPIYADPEDQARLALELPDRGVATARELEIVCRDGSRRFVLTTGQAVRDAAGNVRHFQSTHVDVTARKRAEAELRDREARLAEQHALLEQKTAALRELMAQLKTERTELEQGVQANLNQTVFPLLQRAKDSRSVGVMHSLLDILEENLREVASSFGGGFRAQMAALTRREMEISRMVREGLSSKRIAELLGISYRSVTTHRRNIRRKLGLSAAKVNLSSFLHELQ